MSDIKLDQTQTFAQMVNSDQLRKFLTPTNFKVVEVRPVLGDENHNTEVEVEVDLFAGLVTPQPCENRFITRHIKVMRVDMNAAAKHAGFEVNENGSFQATLADDVETFVTGIAEKMAIDPEEVTFIKRDDSVFLAAKPNSVGFTGGVSFQAGGDGGETPVDPVDPTDPGTGGGDGNGNDGTDKPKEPETGDKKDEKPDTTGDDQSGL